MSRNFSLGIFAIVVFVASILCNASRLHADDRQPIPDETAQKEATALVQEVFGKEFEEATSPDQKLTLTKKLLEEASAPDTTSSGRYSLLQAALDNAPAALNNQYAKLAKVFC